MGMFSKYICENLMPTFVRGNKDPLSEYLS